MRLLEKKNVNTPLQKADALLSVALSMAESLWPSEFLFWVLCLNLSSWGFTLMNRIENYSCISQGQCQLQEGWMKDNLVRINLINIYIIRLAYLLHEILDLSPDSHAEQLVGSDQRSGRDGL